MVTCDIPLKSNFHTSSMTSGPLLPFLKCLLLDFFVISSFYSAIDMLRCGTWRWRTEKRRGKNNMKKRVTEGEKYEVQDSKWWSTEEFEETEGKGEKLTNLKLCWILWRHTHRSIYISSFPYVQNSPSLYCFRPLLCFRAHDTTFRDHTVLGLNLSSPNKIPYKHTVLRIWSAARPQDTGNKSSPYQFSCNIVCDQ